MAATAPDASMTVALQNTPDCVELDIDDSGIDLKDVEIGGIIGGHRMCGEADCRAVHDRSESVHSAIDPLLWRSSIRTLAVSPLTLLQ